MADVNFVNSKFTLKADTPQHIKDFFLNTDLDVPEEFQNVKSSIGILSLLRGCDGCYEGWDKHFIADVQEDGSISIEARISRKRIRSDDVQAILVQLCPYLKVEPFDILSKVSYEQGGTLNVLVFGPNGTIDKIELRGYYASEFGYVTDSKHPSNFFGTYYSPWTYVPFYEQYNKRAAERLKQSFF